MPAPPGVDKKERIFFLLEQLLWDPCQSSISLVLRVKVRICQGYKSKENELIFLVNTTKRAGYGIQFHIEGILCMDNKIINSPCHISKSLVLAVRLLKVYLATLWTSTAMHHIHMCQERSRRMNHLLQWCRTREQSFSTWWYGCG